MTPTYRRPYANAQSALIGSDQRSDASIRPPTAPQGVVISMDPAREDTARRRHAIVLTVSKARRPPRSNITD